jgi:predicted small lipoprotein YifL
MRRSILLLPACLAFVAISGCGNKGPLYYPAPTPAPAHPAPKPAPAHASTVVPAQASTAEAPASASSVVTKPLSGG